MQIQPCSAWGQISPRDLKTVKAVINRFTRTMTALAYKLTYSSPESLPRDPVHPDRSDVLSFSASQGSDRNCPHTLRLRTLSGRFTVYSPMGLSALGISRKGEQPYYPADNLPNHGDRNPRGWHGLPRAGRELLEDGIVLLYQDAKASGQTLVFWTLTMPTRYQDGEPLSDADHRLLLENWDQVEKRTFEELQREQQRLGLLPNHVRVTEIQEQRWNRDRVLALHTHAVFVNQWDPNAHNPDSNGFRRGYWKMTTAKLDDIVTRVYSNLLGRPVDCSACSQVEQVKGLRKLGEYLAKCNRISRYMGKGGKVLGEVRQSSYGPVLPRSWYGSDLRTKQRVRASVLDIDVGFPSLKSARETLEKLSLEFQLEHDRPLFTPLHTVEVSDDEGTFPVAVCGRVWWLTDIPNAIHSLTVLTPDTVYYDGV